MNIFAIPLQRAAALAVVCALLFALPGAARAQLPVVQFAAASGSADEDNSRHDFNITRTGGTTALLSVAYSINHITTDAADFFSTTVFSGTVTIPVGATEAALSIGVKNDFFVEDPNLDRAPTSESFRVDIEANAAYTIGGNGALTVEVPDSLNMHKPVVVLGADTATFSDPTLTAKYDGGMAAEVDAGADIPISIGRNRPQGEATFYLVAAEGGSADSDDYVEQEATFGGETITYLSKVTYTGDIGTTAGDGVMTFTITLVDDRVTEGEETLEYTIATFSADPAPDLAHYWNVHSTAGSGSLIITEPPPSDDATLSALAPSFGMLDPVFASDTFTYTLAVANSDIAFTPTVTDRASVEIQAGSVSAAVASGEESEKIDLDLGAPKEILLVVTSQSETAVNTYQITATREKSGDATLPALATSAGADGVFTPAFPTAGTFDYALSIASEHASIVMEVQDPADSANLLSSETLTAGMPSSAIPLNVSETKQVSLKVTSEDEMATSTYTLSVLRELSMDARLREFQLSTGEIIVVREELPKDSYTAHVAHAVDTITVLLVPNHPDATIIRHELNGREVSPGAALPLNPGANTLTFAVLAPNGTFNFQYQLTIHRALSPDATLQSLSASPGILLPKFDPAVASYTVRVENAVTAVTLTPAATQSGARILVGGGDIAAAQPLDVGDNEIPVAVTSPDNAHMLTYTVTATRVGTGLNANSTLRALTLSEGALTFEPGTTTYNLPYASTVTGITITPTADHEDALIVVGGEQIESGGESGRIAIVAGAQEVFVVVVAADASTTTYTLTIDRAAGLPGAPQNLMAEGINEGIDLRWEAADPNGAAITGYQVRWKLQSAAAYEPAVEESNLEYAITGLANDSAYQAQVRAQNSVGESGWAAAVATPAALRVAQPPDLQFAAGVSLDPPIPFPVAQGGSKPYEYLLIGLPSSILFNRVDPALSGAAPAEATATPLQLTYLVTDDLGVSVEWKLTLTVKAFSLAVGGSGSASPPDGIMIARYLLGVTEGDGLTEGQSNLDADTVASRIKTGVDEGVLDVDDSGATDKTDGLLILRYLLGLRGAALTAGLVEAGEEETKAAVVEENMEELLQ